MTLNIAHGRGERAHQMFLSEATIRAHLQSIAAVLARERIDVAALQECDVTSFWNGGFNHLEYLGQLTESLAHGIIGEHMRGPKLRYGAALLSRFPLERPEAHRFIDPVPLPRKGCIAAELSWPGDPDFRVLAISLHFDFLRHGRRKRQAEAIIQLLRNRGLPAIVMGDFNCDWRSNDSPLRHLARCCSLSVFEPDNHLQVTFPTTGRRWDWILLSRGIRFVNHQVITDVLSDHRAVFAEIERE